ncbi:flagellar hook capping FlgD N-terminal domain-containing protein [Bosea sp. BK604]|uniref:flagellar hook capping FlgD N-terminal domain-containing protein n=1 Tax=Bosea sp. BK604 TaxID=2512180 RepID=UPI00104E325C|nr:flagellar hook capping FlgD N-terminal domain-containing protein [Bosea sp. BK604]TCR63665.1 flagellar hook capping protein [Bosea sp. BK604]
MDVSSSTGAPPAAQNNNSNNSSNPIGNVDYDTFLKLLIAQARNQDPTNPTDPSQYVQQFATLSQVEQAVRTNTKLDEIIAALKPAAPEQPEAPSDAA